MVGRSRQRVVVIGDLNGAYDVLVDILRGTKLVDQALQWSGGRAELVQLGDLFNRGAGAVLALRLRRGLEWTPEKTRVLWDTRTTPRRQ